MSGPVSAVITTLNEGKYIASCIESLLKQTVRPDEIILVDAQSTDKTLEIAREYPVDRLFQVRFHDVYRSKRVGILLSRNDRVLCIDGDSLIAPDFIERGLKLLDEGYNVATGYIYPHNTNPISNYMSWAMNNDFVWRTPCLSGPAYLITKTTYLSTCEIRQVDGLADVCETSKEVPLQKFEKVIKCPDMVIYTELPSTEQKKAIMAIIVATAIILPTAFLFWKKKL